MYRENIFVNVFCFVMKINIEFSLCPSCILKAMSIGSLIVTIQ